MRGEFIGVWPEAKTDIWDVLASEETAPDDLFCELYRALSVALKNKLKPEELADIIDDPVQSRDAFRNVSAEDFAGERLLMEFFEGTHEVLIDLVSEAFANLYFNLLS